MKMLKRVLAALLAVCMLSGLLTAAAFAESDYKTGRIAFFKDGTEVSDFAAGDIITAKVKVKSATSTDSLMFMLMLYQDDMLYDMAFDNKPAAASAVEYSAELEIPDNTDNLELTAVLWDNLKDMNAICSSSILPVTNIKLLELSVNGEPIEGFSPDVTEYTIEIPADTTELPKIEYKAVDNGVKVSITDPSTFPGQSIVTVTAPGTSDESTVYTINYSAPLVSNITAVSSEADIANFQYGTNFDLGTKLFPNYTAPGAVNVTEVHDSIKGLDYITSEAGSYTNGKSTWNIGSNDPKKAWYKFTLGRPATLIFLKQNQNSFPDFLLDDGWEKHYDSSVVLAKTTAPFSTAFTVTYEKHFEAAFVKRA